MEIAVWLEELQQKAQKDPALKGEDDFYEQFFVGLKSFQKSL